MAQVLGRFFSAGLGGAWASTRVTEAYLHSSRTHMEAAVTALGEYRKQGSRENILLDDA